MKETRPKKKSWRRRLIKWAFAITGFLLITVGVLLLITQTRPFKNWVLDYALEKVNENLAGQMAVERLDGNLLSNVQLENISISIDGDTVVYAASIRLRYDLWALLDGIIYVDSLVIDSPFLRMDQSTDSVWNLSRLLLADSSNAMAPDTAAEQLGYDIDVRNFRLLAGTADIIGLDTTLPRRIDNIRIQLSARYSTDQQYLAMQEFRLRTIDPDILITDLTFEALVDSASVAIQDLILQTARNRATASANLYLEDPARSTAILEANSVDCLEFERFLPSSIVALKPVVTVRADLDGDSLCALLKIASGGQVIDINSCARTVSALFDTNARPYLSYTANVAFQKVALAKWLDNPDADLVLNGSLLMQGSGTNLEELRADVRSNLKNCWIGGRRIPTLSVDARYAAGDAAFEANTAGSFGKVAVSGNLHDVLGDVAYNADIKLERFDIGKLVLADTLTTDLDLTASVKGRGTTLESVRGELEVVIGPSLAGNLKIDNGYVSLYYSEDGARIDTMFLATEALSAQIAGNVGWNRSGDLRYVVYLSDGAALTAITDSMVLGGTGQITGNLSGTLDSVATRSSFDFRGLALLSANLSRLHGEIEAFYIDSAITAGGSIKGEDVAAHGMALDSLFLEGAFRRDSAHVAIGLYSPEGLRADCVFSVALDSLIRVIVGSLSFDYNGTRWVAGSDSTVVTINEDIFTVENLELSSPAADGSLQSIKLAGVVNLAGESNTAITIENLALGPLASLFDVEFGASMSANFNLSGVAENPELKGRVSLSDGRYKGYQFHRLEGDLDYSQRRATFVLNFKPTVRDSLTVGGSVPLAFTLADSSDIEPADSSIDVRIIARRLPLDVLRAAGYRVEKAGGDITLDVAVSNTLEDPHFAGKVQIRDGSISLPEYGINYQDVEAGITVEPRKIILDSLVVREDKGSLRADGTVTFDSSLISGNISASRVHLVARDFYAVRHRHYEVQLSSDVGLEGTDKEPTYSGTVTVHRSRFYLPALTGESGTDPLEEATLPMLAVATSADTVGSADSTHLPESLQQSSDSTQSAIVENLRGILKIRIPKNTWIRSPDLRLELAGEVEVVKEGRDFELFGDIKVVRGHYQLYGKRFTVKRGELSFQGGADYVAALDIEAAYVFRTASREKKTLRLFVGGTSESPSVSFTLDDGEISEGDAVSYIVFGRSLDELTQGQRAAVSDGSESQPMAGKVAASLLAGQLSKALGDKLDLDVIEIKAQGDLQSAAVVIGKYLTPDLFMSYQRSFGSVSDDDLEPEKVTLEYQLTRLFYLQLTEGDAEEAGFDVILKVQSR